MYSSDSPLPSFENPPVVETVLSVQFEKLDAMQTVHFGRFWERISDQYPRTEDRRPLLQSAEVFSTIPMPGRFRLESVDTPELPRVWFLSEDGSRLLQVQNDRFVANWRKAAPSHEYPRYDALIKPSFDKDFQTFLEFVDDSELGSVHVNQCEVTYVNHIVSGEGWNNFHEIDRVFSFLKTSTGAGQPSLEDAGIHLRYRMQGQEGKPIGRLHVDIQPAASTEDNRNMFVMNLTARGLSGKGTEFLDVGRRWIVNTFDALTTPDMHRIWRKVT